MRIREFRVDLPRESATEIVEFLNSLNSSGWLISFEKRQLSSKDNWRGWVESPSLSSNYQLKKLTDFAISKGLTKGQYAFPLVNDGDKWFSYICKHKSKDVIEVHHSYSTEDLEEKYKKATEWLSKVQEGTKRIPFLRRCIDVAKQEVLFKHTEQDSYLLRYDLIHELMYRMFRVHKKVFNVHVLQRYCIGVANHFEETYGSNLLQGRKCQQILGEELSTTITELFKEVDPAVLEISKNYILYNDLS